MKQTLIEMVKEILSSMDSDDVDSITETDEAMQVAMLLRGMYLDIVIESDLPETYDIFRLEALADTTKPVLMTMPTEIVQLSWIKYDIKDAGDTYPNFREVKLLSLPDFLYYVNTFKDEDATNLGSFSYESDWGTTTFLYHDDAHPQYYTTTNDGDLIFDSYDSTIDTTGLDYTKTQCWGTIDRTFTLSDNFTPELDHAQFRLLMNEAKARAFVELKQTSNTNAEGHARRQRIRLRNTKDRIPVKDALPNYGRK